MRVAGVTAAVAAVELSSFMRIIVPSQLLCAMVNPHAIDGIHDVW